jgi:trigger factor
MSNQTREQFDADLEQRARRAVKVSLILDQVARDEELDVDQAELSAYVTRQAEQLGVPPQRLAQQWADDGRLSFAVAELRRGKAMNLIAERVKVTDTSGQPVDVKAVLNAPAGSEQAEADDEAEDGEDAEDEA